MKIYISYRRDDARWQAGRLADRLVARFGTDAVFKDVPAFSAETGWRSALKAEIERSDVVLVVMGPMWLRAVDETGRRRLDDPGDLVRTELEMALSRPIPVVPILVDETRFPDFHLLPPSLSQLADFNGFSLHYSSFHADADYLIRILEENVSEVDFGKSRPVAVFVSHAAHDRKWVEEEIVALLSGNRIEPWYSKTSINTASQWEREILRGLESCDWFLLVVSPRAAKSEWIKDELNWAVYNRPERIVPVIMEGRNLWDFHIRLPRIQNIDFTHDLSSAKRALVGMFKKDA